MTESAPPSAAASAVSSPHRPSSPQPPEFSAQAPVSAEDLGSAPSNFRAVKKASTGSLVRPSQRSSKVAPPAGRTADDPRRLAVSQGVRLPSIFSFFLYLLVGSFFLTHGICLCRMPVPIDLGRPSSRSTRFVLVANVAQHARWRERIRIPSGDVLCLVGNFTTPQGMGRRRRGRRPARPAPLAERVPRVARVCLRRRRARRPRDRAAGRAAGRRARGGAVRHRAGRRGRRGRRRHQGVGLAVGAAPQRRVLVRPRRRGRHGARHP
jgi:hypothetical protein